MTMIMIRIIIIDCFNARVNDHVLTIGQGIMTMKMIIDYFDARVDDHVLDPVGSTVRYEKMKLCTGSVQDTMRR